MQAFLQLSILIVIERVILIISRKSPASARFISLMLNLVFPTYNQNDDQKEKKSHLKTKIMEPDSTFKHYLKKGLTDTIFFLMIFNAQKYLKLYLQCTTI